MSSLKYLHREAGDGTSGPPQSPGRDVTAKPVDVLNIVLWSSKVAQNRAGQTTLGTLTRKRPDLIGKSGDFAQAIKTCHDPGGL